jgi:hypothetical protein
VNFSVPGYTRKRLQSGEDQRDDGNEEGENHNGAKAEKGRMAGGSKELRATARQASG